MALIDELLELKTKLNNIGNAIRAKTGETAKLTLAEMPNEIASIESGGSGGSIEGKQKITVIDYDGTIIEESYVAEGEKYTLPTPPTQSDLTFQKWACPIQIVNNQITVENYPITIAPIYKANNVFEFHITLNKATGLLVNLEGIYASKIYWGDGNVDRPLNSSVSHTYSSYGSYVIYGKGISANANANKVDSYVFAQVSSSPNLYCKKIYLGSSFTEIADNAFAYCTELEHVVIPNNVTKIGSSAFSNCCNLKNIIIPSNTTLGTSSFTYNNKAENIVLSYGITDIGSYIVESNCKAKYLILPDTVTTCASLGTYALVEFIKTPLVLSCKYFYKLKKVLLKECNSTSIPSQCLFSCKNIENFDIPNTVTSIGTSAFNSAMSLKELKIPSAVLTIPASAFSNCISIETIDFSNHTSVPTLSATSAFSKISGQAKIIVPDSLYNTWCIATNWASYSKYIYKVSEVYNDRA